MKLSKLALTTVFSLLIVFCLGIASTALAGPDKDPLGLAYGEATGLSNQDVRFTIGRIISVALGVLGTVVVVIMIIAGFEWMTAGGNSDKVEEAKKRITHAIIGLAIILSAYAITDFVTRNLYKATNNIEYPG